MYHPQPTYSFPGAGQRRPAAGPPRVMNGLNHVARCITPLNRKPSDGCRPSRAGVIDAGLRSARDSSPTRVCVATVANRHGPPPRTGQQLSASVGHGALGQGGQTATFGQHTGSFGRQGSPPPQVRGRDPTPGVPRRFDPSPRVALGQSPSVGPREGRGPPRVLVGQSPPVVTRGLNGYAWRSPPCVQRTIRSPRGVSDGPRGVSDGRRGVSDGVKQAPAPNPPPRSPTPEVPSMPSHTTAPLGDSFASDEVEPAVPTTAPGAPGAAPAVPKIAAPNPMRAPIGSVPRIGSPPFQSRPPLPVRSGLRGHVRPTGMRGSFGVLPSAEQHQSPRDPLGRNVAPRRAPCESPPPRTASPPHPRGNERIMLQSPHLPLRSSWSRRHLQASPPPAARSPPGSPSKPPGSMLDQAMSKVGADMAMKRAQEEQRNALVAQVQTLMEEKRRMRLDAEAKQLRMEQAAAEATALARSEQRAAQDMQRATAEALQQAAEAREVAARLEARCEQSSRLQATEQAQARELRAYRLESQELARQAQSPGREDGALRAWQVGDFVEVVVGTEHFAVVAAGLDPPIPPRGLVVGLEYLEEKGLVKVANADLGPAKYVAGASLALLDAFAKGGRAEVHGLPGKGVALEGKGCTVLDFDVERGGLQVKVDDKPKPIRVRPWNVRTAARGRAVTSPVTTASGVTSATVSSSRPPAGGGMADFSGVIDDVTQHITQDPELRARLEAAQRSAT